MNLRQYQHDVIADLERADSRKVIIVAPTGAGKTIIGAAVIRRAIDNGQSVLVLAHTREIIKQTSRKLSDHGIEHGIIQAGLVATPDEPVQVASIQTLWSRAMRTDRMALPAANMLIVDECHHCPANTYRKIIDAYPNAMLIGLTATPARGDGRGLGGIFDTIIECPQVAELIEQKYLVRTRVFAPVDPDLKGVETRVGDYVESQLADRMDRPQLIGDIISHWHKYGERRKTVCFAVNVQHSIHIRDEFIKSGVKAEHVDGSTPKPDRDAALARLASGETELITNCMVLTEGWTCPRFRAAFWRGRQRKWACTGKWLVACCGRPMASSMRSYSIIPVPYFGMVLSRIASNGGSIRTSVRKARRTLIGYRTAHAHAYWNAVSAVQCGPPARNADIVVSCHSGRQGLSYLMMVILPLSTAIAEQLKPSVTQRID